MASNAEDKMPPEKAGKKVLPEVVPENRARENAAEQSIFSTSKPAAANLSASMNMARNGANLSAVAGARSTQLGQKLGESANRLEKSAPIDGELEGMHFDSRANQASVSSITSNSMARLDIARGIATQLGDFARALPEKPVEIRLSPEELGRVRMSISASESGVTLHVIAERPETLELMRRHAELLAKELANLGFSSIDLAFGQGQQNETDSESSGSGDDSGARGENLNEVLDLELTTTSDQSPAQGSEDGVLDIRI